MKSVALPRFTCLGAWSLVLIVVTTRVHAAAPSETPPGGAADGVADGRALAQASQSNLSGSLSEAALLPGSIIAFYPQASGFSGSGPALRSWLAERGWAICDGTQGTPDLRDRMLYGTTDAATVGQRLGSREHEHRLRGETGPPVLRNRHIPTGRVQSRHIPDDQHRHSIDAPTDRAQHLPPSTRVLFIMRLR